MTRIFKLLLKFCMGMFAILVSASFAFAAVSPKNGNFYIGFTDISYSGGMEPEIQRVYNSKSNFKGVFGWGWGTVFETYLKISADGSVALHEYGGGGDNRFAPKDLSDPELDQAVDMLAAAAMESANIKTPEELAHYKQKLKSDFSFRNREWESLLAQGKVKPRTLPEGAILYSNLYDSETLTRVAQGYLRVSSDGKTQSFDNDGKLVRLADKNNNFINLSYDQAGHPASLIDNFGRKIKFNVNAKGLLESLEGENGARAEYKYNDLDELVYSKDREGNVFSYSYDAQKKHNLTEIGYSDKSTMTMAYYGKESHENIKSVKERDGAVSEYKYDDDPADAGHYKGSILEKSPDGEIASSKQYEYFYKKKAGGEEWLQRKVTDEDGDKTDTTYNEICGCPESIKHNGEEATFEYDAKGRLTKKETPDAIQTLEYDPRLSKVTRVSTRVKGEDNAEVWSKYAYDSRGNLLSAKNSEGSQLKLAYDNNGRIIRIWDKETRRTLTFKYNNNSKPVEIRVLKVGAISVTYDKDNNIESVHSNGGSKIALLVTAQFQKLLAIVKPAGVNLGF